MDKEEIKERIEIYEDTKADLESQLKGKEDRDKECIEYRIECCNEIINQYYEKLNPTKKKEMYK